MRIEPHYHQNTNTLVEDLKKGLPCAYNFLMKNYETQIGNLCLGVLNNQQEAEDITQDTFVEIYRSIHKFRGDANLKTWMYRIAMNKSLNRLKKLNKKRNLSLSHISSDILGFGGRSAQERMEEADTQKVMRLALEALPVRQREAIVLKRLDDYTQEEIAEFMDCSEKAVESLIQRAKQNLKKLLQTYYEEVFKS